ncbi:hypothetical protein HFO89_34220 [Rhizobium leguminosarum]|uniref:hypothetical protein n=1 Tax=Rhizobium leguminosarum TaxID=384 RepID=UPI001C95E66B|nr:hypothetical protein [Rhizobium leguminosarum]MBY5461309.1 hypothetical protein [Rhizobium leguminosarum]
MANQGGSHEQHVKSGQQSHKNAGSQASTKNKEDTQSSGSRGGSHEQQAKAGKQSHRNS